MKPSELQVSDLRSKVYTALKSWHQTSNETNPFADLRLFRQTQSERGDSVRQSINEILFEAIEALTATHEKEAYVLRKHFIDRQLVYAIANSMNVSDATVYRLQNDGLNRVTQLIQRRERHLREFRCTQLEQRLEPPTYEHLIGVDTHLEQLGQLVTSTQPPWLVAIEGMGGIGKTALADSLSRRLIRQDIIGDFGWVSARSHIFNLGGGIKAVTQPALTAEGLIEQLLNQLMPDLARSPPFSAEDALTNLRSRLKHQPHLIVIDNLETIIDLDTLLPTLRQLIDPTKFLLTSRESLYHEAGLYHFNLPPLSETNAFQLIRHEALLHNLPDLAQAGEDTLEKIFKTVGGNPLALRLVVGQLHIHGLDAILDDLAAARGKKVESMYSFIYRRAWEHLDQRTRKIFLAMPLVIDQGSDVEYLAEITGIDLTGVRDSLDQLVTLNLVNTDTSLNERRYTIHNLTRTFLQEQVAHWS